LGAKKRALVGGRHEAGAPVGSAADRTAARIGHDDAARQAVVQRAQAVAQPGPQARLADLDAAGIELDAAGRMGRGVGVQRANDAQIIGMSSQVWKERAYFKAGLAVTAKRE